jgi:hypothetical protein
MASTRTKHAMWSGRLAGVTLAVGALTLGLLAGPASARVSSVPAATPQLATSGTDGSVEQVRQITQCGGTMYAAGKFSQVRKGTTVLTRNNVFAFSATSPYTISAWNPNVNGQVDTIAFANGDCSAAYIGGAFTTVGGAAVKNTAKVSTSTGAPIAGYVNSSPARVAHIEAVNGHLLMGGYFAGYLKSVSPATGRPDGLTMPSISGTYVFPNADPTTTKVWNMSVWTNRVLVMGVFTQVGGLARKQIFMLNVPAGTGAATVDPWYSPEFNADCATSHPFWLQDAAWSPDGTTVYTATTGYKPWQKTTTEPRSELCDSAAAFSSTASSTLAHKWINYTGCDSLFSVAADTIDRSTVYVGGHQRWADNPNGCDRAGPGASSAPGLGFLSTGTGAHIPGTATRGRGLGADDMLATSAGLWIASDNAQNTSTCAGQSGHMGICFLPEIAA